MRVSFSDTISGAWLGAERLRSGSPLRPDAAPDTHVLVDGSPDALRLVIDVFAPPQQAFPFSDVIAWKGLVLIGHGGVLHVVTLARRKSELISLDGYFGSLVAEGDVCLACSASEILRVAADGSVLWRSGALGADGVIVSDVRDGVIRASGQWDPPDAAWVEFVLDAETGKPIRPTGA